MALGRIGPVARKKPDPYTDTCGVLIDERNDAELVGMTEAQNVRTVVAGIRAVARAVFNEGFDVYLQRLTEDGVFRKKWIMRK